MNANIPGFTFGIIVGLAYAYIIRNVELKKFQSKKPLVRDDEINLPTENLRNLKILCWIASKHLNKASRVNVTWGRRCDKFLVMSNASYVTIDIPLNVVDLNISEGRKFLWHKTMSAFSLIHTKYMNDFDWFLKADDDSYIIIENLKFLLKDYHSSNPIYFGGKRRSYNINNGWHPGGAGYVLSREALKRFVKNGVLKKQCTTYKYTSSEDTEMGRCMETLQVAAGDARDPLNQSRFFPLKHLTVLYPPENIKKKNRELFYENSRLGWKHISDRTISFHYIRPGKLQLLDYLIYQLYPHGLDANIQFDVEDIRQKLDHNRELISKLNCRKEMG